MEKAGCVACRQAECAVLEDGQIIFQPHELLRQGSPEGGQEYVPERNQEEDENPRKPGQQKTGRRPLLLLCAAAGMRPFSVCLFFLFHGLLSIHFPVHAP